MCVRVAGGRRESGRERVGGTGNWRKLSYNPTVCVRGGAKESFEHSEGCARSAVDGGESCGRSKSGHSESSRMDGESRRETRFSQSWLGVVFFVALTGELWAL